MDDFVVIPYTTAYGVHLWTTNSNGRCYFVRDNEDNYIVYGHAEGKIIMMSRDVANYTQNIISDDSPPFILHETTSTWDNTIVVGGYTYRYILFNLPSNYLFELATTNYSSALDFINAVYGITFPITYYPTNVTFDPAPSSAVVGDIVTVGVFVPDGYTIRNPSSNIVVRNNGIIVPHTWDATTSHLTFEMPNPS